MKRPLYLLLILFFSACKPHFEFDRVEHYVTKASEDKIDRLLDFEPSEDDKELSELLFQENLSALDSNFKAKLKQNYSLKSSIKSREDSNIDEVYKPKMFSKINATPSFPIYKDILVFIKDNRIIGVSKIDFNCKSHVTVDSLGHQKEIDMDDFDKLEKLLQ